MADVEAQQVSALLATFPVKVDAESDRYMIVEQHMNADGYTVERELIVTDSVIPGDRDYERYDDDDERRAVLVKYDFQQMTYTARNAIECAKKAQNGSVRYMMRMQHRGNRTDIVCWQYNPTSGFVEQHVMNTAAIPVRD